MTIFAGCCIVIIAKEERGRHGAFFFISYNKVIYMDSSIRREITPAARAEFLELAEKFQKGFLSQKELEDRVYSAAHRFRLLREDEFLPEGIHDPEKYYTHTYNDCSSVIIDFTCRDTVLLPEKGWLDGEKLVLKNDLGLTADLDIKSHTPWDVHWYCTGTIEGYTAAGERKFPEIMILTDDEGNIFRLGYMEDRADEEAFRNFPLWQKYYEWRGEQEKKNRALAMEYYNACAGKTGREND